MIRKIMIIGTLLFIFVLAVTTIIARDIHQFAHKPADREATEKTVVLSPGSGFNSALTKLHQQGLVTQKLKFKIIAKYMGVDKRLKAGEYRLSTAMTPVEILQKLVRGDVYLYRLIIPEGFRLTQIAQTAERAGFTQYDAFMELASDPEYARKLSVPKEALEGYLFPDTYYFSKDVTPDEIIATMVKRFWHQFPESWQQRAAGMGLTIHQVVTLASIIEKETGAPEERPIISAVFHNRLKKKMRLESDPTVIYGIKDFNGNITRKDLRTTTPYNTYRIKGLPPGPIASPGKAAIEATLYPADVPFLYFVSKKDGTHHFSKTLAEHNRAVRKYQLRK